MSREINNYGNEFLELLFIKRTVNWVLSSNMSNEVKAGVNDAAFHPLPDEIAGFRLMSLVRTVPEV